MQTWKWLVLSCAIGSTAGNSVTPTFLDECSITHCGTNGVWLGEGVPFRTLHLRPERSNEAGLRIADFRDSRGSPLRIEVEGDVLRGVLASGEVLSGDKLSGAVLYLATSESRSEPPSHARRKHPGRPFHARYELKIEAVRETEFWTSCEGCTPTFPRYDFIATDLNDGREVEFCTPALDDRGGVQGPSIQGTAVIFRGDLYDDRHQVTNSSEAADPYDDDVFNIACMGTALSKLHLLRHTVAAHRAPADPPPPPAADRQAMLRLLTADYCGDGSAFTSDALPIKLGFDNPHFELRPESGYPMDGAGVSIEALWSADGATCLGTRLRDADDTTEALVSDIQRACGKVGRPVPPRCETIVPLPSLTTPFVMGNYAVSGNPATTTP